MKIVEKKEFAIGEEFRYGLIKLKCIIPPEEYSCSGCAIEIQDCDNCNFFLGPCANEERSDKTDVIFIKVK